MTTKLNWKSCESELARNSNGEEEGSGNCSRRATLASSIDNVSFLKLEQLFTSSHHLSFSSLHGFHSNPTMGRPSGSMELKLDEEKVAELVGMISSEKMKALAIVPVCL